MGQQLQPSYWDIPCSASQGDEGETSTWQSAPEPLGVSRPDKSPVRLEWLGDPRKDHKSCWWGKAAGTELTTAPLPLDRTLCASNSDAALAGRHSSWGPYADLHSLSCAAVCEGFSCSSTKSCWPAVQRFGVFGGY